MTRRRHPLVIREPECEVRPIPGFEGLYSAAADGRIWSHPKQFGRAMHGGQWLKPGANEDGYLIVVLVSKGKKKTVRVNRMVAMAWIPNPDGLPKVNHDNGIKTDNAASNLEWCTQAHNIEHAYRTGLNPTRRILNAEQLAAVRAALTTGEMGKDIAARFGLQASMVSLIKTGKYIERKPLTTPEKTQ